MKTKYSIVAILLASAAMLSGCWHKVYAWNQKLTIEVEANGKVYAGSSVIRVEWNEAYGSAMTGRPNESRMRGEAAFVDIPGKGTLFALLRSPKTDEHPKSVAFFTFGYVPKPGIDKESFNALSHAQGRSAVVAPDQYPMLVTFGDIDEPKSVKEVDPQNLAASFGAGVRLKRIVLEITDEPVTTLVEEKLPWLADIGGGYLHGGNTSRGAPLGLHGGNFIWEN